METFIVVGKFPRNGNSYRISESISLYAMIAVILCQFATCNRKGLVLLTGRAHCQHQIGFFSSILKELR